MERIVTTKMDTHARLHTQVNLETACEHPEQHVDSLPVCLQVGVSLMPATRMKLQQQSTGVLLAQCSAPSAQEPTESHGRHATHNTVCIPTTQRSSPDQIFASDTSGTRSRVYTHWLRMTGTTHTHPSCNTFLPKRFATDERTQESE